MMGVAALDPSYETTRPLTDVYARENMNKTILLAVVAIAILSGCGLQPVQPWEKGDLAKPAMSFALDPLDDKFMQHIYNSKENASGGYGVGGGGCGCN